MSLIEAKRLDSYLCEICEDLTRNKALDLIKNGKVAVEGEVITKPSFKVDSSKNIEIALEDLYVSRAAKKLKDYLEKRDLRVENKSCLDIGSSTGGFTQILLEYGARRVTCVDTGKEQLHKSLKSNPKIALYEETDIREFKSSEVYDLVTCDVSFVSVVKLLESIDRFFSSRLIILFKPQFEVGIDAKRSRKGVVLDTKKIQEARDIFLKNALELGWKLERVEESSVKGKEGNIEFIYEFFRD